MKEVIQESYQLPLGRSIKYQNLTGYEGADGYYLILPATDMSDDAIYEQRAICEYLRSSGIEQIALPMFTEEGKLHLTLNEEKITLLHVVPSRQLSSNKDGTSLAQFHEVGTQYPYEPQTISSYGKWQRLWEEKLDVFHDIYEAQWLIRPSSSFQRLFIETFPYIEGLTENAIQYLQESEKDWRYQTFDQGTITFHRLSPKQVNGVIWPSAIHFDHPMRDLAEWIRYHILSEGKEDFHRVVTFINEYESKRPLSVFSWRLLYARLLLPIHLFDYLEKAMVENDLRKPEYKIEYKQLLNKQLTYEKNLRDFFEMVGLDAKQLNIPTIDW